MKKEESKVIAQKLQKIPNGTLALKHCRAGGTGSTLFGEQFRAVTAGKGCMEAYETFPGIEVSFNVFLASEVKFRHDASDSVLEIYYCRSGRVGWNMQGGTAVYLGTGDVTAHSIACCADSIWSLAASTCLVSILQIGCPSCTISPAFTNTSVISPAAFG